MHNFIYIGYDIWPKPTYLREFTNTTTWERDEVYDEIRIATGIEENFLQLLNPKNEQELNTLYQQVNSSIEESVLILVAIEEDIYNIQKSIVSSINPTFISNFPFSLIGFDICDINGFFSVFDMGIDFFSRNNLLDENELEEATNLTKLANDLVPEHAPFHLVKLFKVEGKSR